MKCEICGKETSTIVHVDGVDKCMKCHDAFGKTGVKENG